MPKTHEYKKGHHYPVQHTTDRFDRPVYNSQINRSGAERVTSYVLMLCFIVSVLVA